MAEDALSRMPLSQKDYSNVDDDKTESGTANVHDVVDKKIVEEVEPLNIEYFLAAQHEGTSCLLLPNVADAPDSSYFYIKFGIHSRRALLNGEKLNLVLLSLKTKVLEKKHDPIISGHPGRIHMYITM